VPLPEGVNIPHATIKVPVRKMPQIDQGGALPYINEIIWIIALMVLLGSKFLVLGEK
jgi:hypothetical protein